MDAPFTIQGNVLSNGACSRVANEAEALQAFNDPNRTAWIHLEYRDAEAISKFLLDSLGFHELAVEDSLSYFERPTLHEYDDHLFLSIAEVVSVNGMDEYREVGFFLTQSSLVTVSGHPSPHIDQWFQRWQRNPDRVGTRPAEVMHAVIDTVVDQYYIVADNMEEAVDDLVDEIYQGDNRQLRNLLQLKRRLIEMRRHVTPIRDIMNGLLRRDLDLIPIDTRVYFQDVYDHTLRLSELADINRETLTSALDVHLSAVSNNLNTVMKKMTVISTVLMSGALIAGIYGMNFKHMPELNWFWGYPFALLLMVASGLLIMGLFRWKKWI